MFAFAQAVPFTRVDDQFGGNILLAQGTIKCICLADWHTIISLSVSNQCWRLHAANIGNRRMLAVYLRVLSRANDLVAQVAHIPVWDIGLRVVAMEVANAGSHDSCLEARGLSDCPRGHKAAITPTHDANPVSINQPLLNQVIDAI